MGCGAKPPVKKGLWRNEACCGGIRGPSALPSAGLAPNSVVAAQGPTSLLVSSTYTGDRQSSHTCRCLYIYPPPLHVVCGSREKTEARSKPAKWVEPTGIEVVTHLLVGGLDESGVAQHLLDLGMGGIAPDVLFLEHLPQMCPLPNTVSDVL